MRLKGRLSTSSLNPQLQLISEHIEKVRKGFTKHSPHLLFSYIIFAFSSFGFHELETIFYNITDCFSTPYWVLLYPYWAFSYSFLYLHWVFSYLHWVFLYSYLFLTRKGNFRPWQGNLKLILLEIIWKPVSCWI